MDKFEYKVRADEIKELIAKGEYAQAAEIADEIDWRRVKSVMMLCTISDLYKINKRYEDAKSLLLMAYERRPGGKTICYSLCELCLKTKEYDKATVYYKEYVEAAPTDPGRYILQYKLYEAQGVNLDERIAVLQELKERDYREKWAYELAFLYHKTGQATRCVEECDELILWFGDGKYVIKAMELKMFYEPLSASQQEKYDHRFDEPQEPAEVTTQPQQEEQGQAAEEPEEIAGQPETWESEQAPKKAVAEGFTAAPETYEAQETETSKPQEPKEEPDMEIQVQPMEFGQYNTINLQAALAEGLKEVLDKETEKVEEAEAEEKRALEAYEQQAPTAARKAEPVPEATKETAVEDVPDATKIFDASKVLEALGETTPQPPKEDAVEEEMTYTKVLPVLDDITEEVPGNMSEIVYTEQGPAAVNKEPEQSDGMKEITADGAEEQPASGFVAGADPTEAAAMIMSQMRQEAFDKAEHQVLTAQPPKEMAGVLSQEADGQISLVMPTGNKAIDDQITGQISLDDVLLEWEKIKQQSEEKRKEEVRQHVLEHTGSMFTEFEASIRDGLLEQIESGKAVGIVEPQAQPEEETEGSVEEGTVDYEELPEEYAPEEEHGVGMTEITATGEEAEPAAEEAEAAETEEESEGAESTAEEAEAPETAEATETGEYAGDEYGVVEEIEEIIDPSVEEAEGYEAAGEAEETFETEEEGEGVEPAAEEAEAPETAEEGEGAEPAVEEAEAPEKKEKFDIVDEFEDPQDQEKATDKKEAEEEESEEKDAAGDEKEQAAEKNEGQTVEREKSKVRSLTPEEKELYGAFIQSRADREKIVKAVDGISMAAYTGNIIITGDEGMDTLTLAKNMIREVQMTDSNFSGKVAKISGRGMNNKDTANTLEHLKYGALIIQKASEMNDATARALYRALQQDYFGIIVVIEDTRRGMHKLLKEHPELKEVFTARMDVEALSNETLAEIAKKYAREKEYSIDEFGLMALHARIADMQTSDHNVTIAEVRELVDEAIDSANRKTPGHFFDILFGKRYDDEDMIILTEKDFT